jgi:O-antigen/teichoic acid export membrane protein
VLSSAAKVARGSSSLLLRDTLKIPALLLTLAYLTRMLSLTELGTILGLSVIMQIFSAGTDPGFSNALVVHCAEAVGRKQSPRPLILRVSLIGTVLSSIASLGFFVVGMGLTGFLPKMASPSDIIYLASLDLFISSLAPYMGGSLLGLQDFKSSAIIDTVGYFAKQLTGVALVASGMGVYGVVLGWVFGDSLYLIEALIVVGRDSTLYSTLPPFEWDIRSLLIFSLPIYGSLLIEFLSGWFDRIFVLAAFRVEELAIYTVALSIFNGVAALPGIVSSVLLPHFSERYMTGGEQTLRNEGRDAARYITLIFAPFYLGLGAVALPVITIFAGPSYANGALILMVLCIFGGLTLPSSGFDELMLALKKTRFIVISAVVSTVTLVILSLVLGPWLSITGIAIARGIALVAVFLVMWWGVRTLLALELKARALAKILFCGFAMFLVVFTVQQLFYSLYMLILYLILGVVSYAILLKAFRVLRRRDFDVMRELVGSRLRPLIDFIEMLIGTSSR